MRNLVMAAVMVIGVMGLGGSAQAQTAGEYVKAAGMKLGHGALAIPYSLADVVSTPVGYAVQLDSDGRSALGVALGIPFGFMNAAVRAGLGTWDVLTFPFVDANRTREFRWDPYVTGFNPFGPRPESAAAFAASPTPRRPVGRPSFD